MFKQVATGWTQIVTVGLLSVALSFVGLVPVAAATVPPELRIHVERIDDLLTGWWQEHQQSPNAPLSDELFCRRVYLDLIGRIPTYYEFLAFTGDRSADKRSRLIQDLLHHPGYVSHHFHFWADLLRATDRLDRVSGEPYKQWINESLTANKPYNVMVRELMLSEGNMWEQGNGATGYVMRDAGMPLDNMANTLRIFAGTRVACAQCHDHPFDTWTRKEFFAAAAFNEGTDLVRGRKRLRELTNYAKKNNMTVSAEERRYLRNFLDNMGSSVGSKSDGSIKLPDDYQYDDGNPGDPIQAQVPFGQPVMGLDPKTHSREAFARWLTGSDNPRFSEVMANRLWKRLFGVGLVEPVDDWRADTQAVFPELMYAIAEIFKTVDYDIRRFQSIIMHTNAYQRAASREEWSDGETYYFTGPLLRRMSAEQTWDSLLTLVVPKVDERKYERRRDYNELYAYYREATPAQIFADVQEYRSAREELNVIHRRMRELRNEKKWDEVKKLRPKRDELDAVRRRFEGRGDAKERQREDRPWRGFDDGFVRASALPSPAPAGHFLGEFGQSDRQQIDNSHKDAAVTQTLTLFNGVVDRHVMNKRSVLSKEIARCETPEQTVAVIFRSLLGRSLLLLTKPRC